MSLESLALEELRRRGVWTELVDSTVASFVRNALELANLASETSQSAQAQVLTAFEAGLAIDSLFSAAARLPQVGDHPAGGTQELAWATFQANYGAIALLGPLEKQPAAVEHALLKLVTFVASDDSELWLLKGRLIGRRGRGAPSPRSHTAGTVPRASVSAHSGKDLRLGVTGHLVARVLLMQMTQMTQNIRLSTHCS